MPSSSPPHYSSVVGSPQESHSDLPPLQYSQQQHQQVQPSSASAYTLATIYHDDPSHSHSYSPRSQSPVSFNISIDSDRAPLLPSNTSPVYGAAPISPNTNRSTRRVLINAGLKMSALFIVSTLVLGGTLWLALPTLEQQDRQYLRVPKSFVQLQELNMLLKKYRDIYPARIVICYITTYLFLQAFSLPGSMYLSILGGAVWGVPIALPLACTCVASGATLCYLISAALGPAILALPKWKARLDSWSTSLASQRENLLSYLIVLRIAPFPPHWVVNVLAPHLGIGLFPFWISTFLGILGVTVIHTTIGGGLDEMTSAADFHLLSWKNFLGLSAVVIGVLIPVGLRFVLKKRVGEIALEPDAEVDEEAYADGVNNDQILAQGPFVGTGMDGKGKKVAATGQLILLSDSEGEDDNDDEVLDGEEDEILEVGPLIDLNDKDASKDNRIRLTSNLVDTENFSNPYSSNISSTYERFSVPTAPLPTALVHSDSSL